MSAIVGALKSGAAGVGALVGVASSAAGAVKSGTKQLTSLSFMNVDKVEEDRLGEDVNEKDEMSFFSILFRLILLPVFVPLFMVYLCLFARGTPIAAELDALQHNVADDDSHSDDDDEEYSDEKNSVRGTFRSALRWMLCRPPPKLVTNDPYKLSYENFLVRQQMQEINKRQIEPYKVDINVARTDKVKFPYDGVFVKNMYIALNDIEALQAALVEVEDAMLKASNDRMYKMEFEHELGEMWGNINKGDSKILLQKLLQQAKDGEAAMSKKQDPYALVRIARGHARSYLEQNAASNAAAAGSDAAGLVSASALGSGSGGAVSDGGTPGSRAAVNGDDTDSSSGGPKGFLQSPSPPKQKSSKPYKAPVSNDTPLEERINLSAVMGLRVEGPGLEHTPAKIVEHYKPHAM